MYIVNLRFLRSPSVLCVSFEMFYTILGISLVNEEPYFLEFLWGTFDSEWMDWKFEKMLKLCRPLSVFISAMILRNREEDLKFTQCPVLTTSQLVHIWNDLINSNNNILKPVWQRNRKYHLHH